MYTYEHVNILHRYDYMDTIHVSVYAMCIFYVYILVSTFTYKLHTDALLLDSREEGMYTYKCAHVSNRYDYMDIIHVSIIICRYYMCIFLCLHLYINLMKMEFCMIRENRACIYTNWHIYYIDGYHQYLSISYVVISSIWVYNIINKCIHYIDGYHKNLSIYHVDVTHKYSRVYIYYL